jgi:hypothetical protein
MEEDRTNLIRTYLEQRKTSLLIPKSSKLKRIKELSSKKFQEQRGANRSVPKLLGNKE